MKNKLSLGNKIGRTVAAVIMAGTGLVNSGCATGKETSIFGAGLGALGLGNLGSAIQGVGLTQGIEEIGGNNQKRGPVSFSVSTYLDINNNGQWDKGDILKNDFKLGEKALVVLNIRNLPLLTPASMEGKNPRGETWDIKTKTIAYNDGTTVPLNLTIPGTYEVVGRIHGERIGTHYFTVK